ncbi:hypothetical protein D3C74_265970 [compost metagenome]
MAFTPPFGPQGTQQPPSSPPPQFTPPQPAATAFAIDPGAIVGCLFRNTFVWLRNGNAFWFFPTFVGRTSIAGFRWTGRTWVFTGVDLRSIVSFTCF